MFQRVGNFLSGGSKTVDDIFDKDSGHLSKIGEWIGNGKFTTEEQAEMQKALVEGVRKFAIDTLSENTERSKTRRQVSLVVIKFYLIVLFMAGMTYPINADWSAIWFSIALTPGLATLVLGVGAFFYGVHVLRTHQGDKK